MAATGDTKAVNKQAPEIFASCSFSSLGLHTEICAQIREKLCFDVPTVVQAQVVPLILSGRHVLVNASTGTGKTLAYLAPMIHLLQGRFPKVQRSDGTFALVLVPTRELCLQVYDFLQKLLHHFYWIVPGYIMGGENRSKEKARLRKGISILVATPGRLLDHLKHTSSFIHTKLQWIVFDEADRILELGFGKEIKAILDILGSRKVEHVGRGMSATCISNFQRQNLLFSATLNEKVNHLANISLENPVTIGLECKKTEPNKLLTHVGSMDEDDSIGHLNEGIKPSTRDYKLPAELVQRYVKVPCAARLSILLLILKHTFEKKSFQKIVVFFSTCDAVDFHYFLLSKFHWKSGPQSDNEVAKWFLSCNPFRLHGNMKHEDRRSMFQAFKTEKTALLLSTDVAARGLDFPKVRHIIQYDCPGEATEYVHRVGRTARIGEKGDSLLFIQPIEFDYLHALEQHGVSLVEYPILKVANSFPSPCQVSIITKLVSLDSHPLVLHLQKQLESLMEDEPKLRELAQKAFCSWVRSYAAHRGVLKKIFMVKKLHLGHVAKSFALKQEPSVIGQSFKVPSKKRKNDLTHCKKLVLKKKKSQFLEQMNFDLQEI